MPSAYIDALHMLSRRALTIAECRSRLADREHTPEQIEAALARLRDSGALDDAKLARAQAQTALEVKGRGRLRVVRELAARGIDRETAAHAVAEVFADRDERSLVTRALQKKLRGRPRPADAAETARLYQHLMRQGFTPAVVSAVLRGLRRGAGLERDADSGRDDVQ
jgi:SOS response regulatory protein OraA/RecX